MKYELNDSGDGQKLEVYGDFSVIRPDPQAIWQKANPSLWTKADAVFSVEGDKRKWKIHKNIPKEWSVVVEGLKFKVGLSNFKHTGIFPEQAENWKWLMEKVISLKNKNQEGSVKVLNLFGYTGGATLALAKAGAKVVHIDASKPAIFQARENMKLNFLDDTSVRWILDDVKKFVKREIKRGVLYDGVVMDPPIFGRGSKGEVWKIEKDLPILLDDVKKILNKSSHFVLLNGYASLYTARAYAQLLSSVFGVDLGVVENGELYIQENNERKFVLPAGIFARLFKI